MALIPLPNIQLRDLSGGMISNASDVLLPPNVAKFSSNFHFDVLGRATQRGGTTQLGATVESSQTPTGALQYINSDGSVNHLLFGFNTSVYAYNGTTWSSVRNSLSGANVRFTQFADVVFMVGGGSETQTYDGSSFSASSLVSGAPTGKYVETFKERVYISGNDTYPDRVFFTTIISSAGSVTWNQTTQWFDVNPEDGNNVTAFGKTSDLLLIFKQRALYRWNGSSLAFVEDIGTTSQESVVSAKGITFFFSANPLGIFVTDGGQPVEISRPVHDFLQAISASFYDNVSAFGDSDHAYFNIGDVTVDSRSYTNVQLVYTISSKNWHVNLFADAFRVATSYETTAGVITSVAGDTDGMVQTIFSGTTDNGSPIVYEYESKQFEFESRATTKRLSELAVFLKNGAGASFAVSSDLGGFRSVGECTGEINIFKGQNLYGHYFKLKVSGSNRFTPVVLEGFEFINGVSLGYVSPS